jgi:colanic acid biosynthesis glycosyl transferase WcaI
LHIFVHDYAGHPFQAQLSRELARRGHRVTHAWFAEDQGPKGRLSKSLDDADGLEFLPMGRGLSYSKTNFLKRRAGDIAYGKACAKWIAENRPDVVISGNTPTEAQEWIVAACRKHGLQFIYWCQDFYSLAASKILSKRLPIIGDAIGAYYRILERRQMHRAEWIIHITDGFMAQTDLWGIPRDKVTVIPNWGALDEIPVMDRETDWAQRNHLRRPARVIYSGTLALKHNPELLKAIAISEPERADVVLVGSGTGADKLAEDTTSPTNLNVIPVQDIADFTEVLASADVLVAVIEAEAGAYSVPSKVWSYLCAGRPIVLAAPSENLASKIVTNTGAGIVVDPNDTQAFINAIRHFLDDGVAAASAGRAGRKYAENTFHVPHIADQFESVIMNVRNTDAA